MKIKVAWSVAGAFPGTSGRQKLIQVCISAIENCPDSRKVLQGLKRQEQNVENFSKLVRSPQKS